MNKKKILIRILLAAWVFIWALFLVRPYMKKGLFRTYRELLPLSLEEKHAYITGKEIYDFIKACKDSIAPASTYSIAGLEKDPLSKERAAYYLYPNTVSKNPDFIFVYNSSGFAKQGYRMFKQLSPDKYILNKET